MRAVKHVIQMQKLETIFSKKRINNCNHKPSQTFKGANDYDKQNYFNNEKENLFNT